MNTTYMNRVVALHAILLGEIEMKKFALAVVLSALFVAPAFASHCPADAKAIDAALVRSSLDEAKKAEIKALRDEGMKLHEAGEHRTSEQTLAKAMRMLLEGNLK